MYLRILKLKLLLRQAVVDVLIKRTLLISPTAKIYVPEGFFRSTSYNMELNLDPWDILSPEELTLHYCKVLE